MPVSATPAVRALAAALLLVLLSTIDASAKRKDDRLVLENGDQLTGEIKKLEQATTVKGTTLIPLAMYFKDMARLAVLRPQEEFESARKLEALEIALWARVLSFAPVTWIVPSLRT